MARLRTIRPNFALSPVTGRISREARLLFILLWPIADDAGRLRLDFEMLREQLFPFDADAPMLLPIWLDELEREGCIERYSTEDAEYLRIPQWKRLQKIQHPSRSRFPGAPHESHETHEDRPERQKNRAFSDDPHEDAFSEEEAALLAEPKEFTQANVLGYLSFALRKSLRQDDARTASARYIELAGRHAGLWGGHGAPVGRKEPSIESLGVPLSKLHGLTEGDDR